MVNSIIVNGMFMSVFFTKLLKFFGKIVQDKKSGKNSHSKNLCYIPLLKHFVYYLLKKLIIFLQKMRFLFQN